MSSFSEKLNIFGTFFTAKRLLMVLVAIAGAAAIIWAFDKFFLFYFARSYVDELSSALGLNRNLASAITWIVFALFVVFIGYVASFSKTRRRIGLLGLLSLFIAQPGLIFYFDKPFDSKGMAQKCYVITRDEIRYGDLAGRDPSTGLECKPLTPEIAERFEEYRQGRRPRKIISPEVPVFFSQRTGNPVVWYSIDSFGLIEAFDLMGFNPITGEELLPVSREIAFRWNAQSKAPERVYPSEEFSFFDPVTGRPTIWYRNDPNGQYEFFNRAGFNPKTGDPLLEVSAAVVSDWKKATAKRCYILTPNSVKYGAEPGIDSSSGRECKTFTPAMLEKLREYERGNRPKRVEASNPTFFDLRSGDPALWFAKNKQGKIELFSLMGFHPETGLELLPVTSSVADLWKEQQAQSISRAPQIVDSKSFVFFDQKTGSARAWYWRSPDGQFEFYDGPGFHPRTGDPLTTLTKELVVKFDNESKKIADERAAKDAEKTVEAARRQTELEKSSKAGRLCDEMGANPNDQMRVGEGVPFDQLKSRSKDALDACELAVKQNPTEGRFQYQLARVLQLSDRPRAASILLKLTAAKYAAAFDNYGWMAYTDRKNPQEAVELFRKGVELNDSDSMVSLAEMIDRGFTQPRGNWEQKLNLYSRAAELGHKTAATAADVERSKMNSDEIAKIQQFQQQQMAAQIFGQILQNMVRR